ncbi:hypothetical protein Pfo_031655 [Paulownia fortunei]|nr:hypothetical protein Pfo_031655 [Paulownia fortunei]
MQAFARASSTPHATTATTVGRDQRASGTDPATAPAPTAPPPRPPRRRAAPPAPPARPGASRPRRPRVPRSYASTIPPNPHPATAAVATPTAVTRAPEESRTAATSTTASTATTSATDARTTAPAANTGRQRRQHAHRADGQRPVQQQHRHGPGDTRGRPRDDRAGRERRAHERHPGTSGTSPTAAAAAATTTARTRRPARERSLPPPARVDARLALVASAVALAFLVGLLRRDADRPRGGVLSCRSVRRRAPRADRVPGRPDERRPRPHGPAHPVADPAVARGAAARILLAVKIARIGPAGILSSTRFRVRWRWTLWCLLPTLVIRDPDVPAADVGDVLVRRRLRLGP